MAFAHFFFFFPSQVSLSFMHFPLLSKKWPIFATSYYYRNMCYPIYGSLESSWPPDEHLLAVLPYLSLWSPWEAKKRLGWALCQASGITWTDVSPAFSSNLQSCCIWIIGHHCFFVISWNHQLKGAGASKKTAEGRLLASWFNRLSKKSWCSELAQDKNITGNIKHLLCEIQHKSTSITSLTFD